ncbi:hypothetical protein [Clostridium disporicum]|uniref:hypothetical protein n=1 Tax=Clostridium disporicum TaxID=84024 RepID=UPI00321B942D
MQNTTANYKLEINKPSREFECKITIGNNIYNNDELVNLTLEHTQPQEGFSIGDTISQSLDLTLLNRGDIIYSTSQIKVEIGLKIGSTIEYILMGIFNIDDIEKTDYTTKFTAYDNMIKFETPYFSSLGDKPTLKQVVNELSKITGIEFIGSLPNYTVSKLEGFTCREVLSYVASICGGNAVITRDGKFTIKSLSEIKKSIDGNNYFDYKREEVKYKIGKISCQIDENNILYKGSTGTDSMELGFENPWVTETILNDVYNKLNGLSYLGYSMKWQGDLSLDPYDIVTVTDIKNVIRKIPILSQKISYTGGLTSEIGAKGESKNKNNFSSSGSTTNKVNRAVIEQAIIKEALIEKANIKDVEAVSIRTQILEAKTAKIEEAIIDVAHISDLNAINANIQNLIANDVKINNALINKADITELNAVVGNINIINSELANIKTLVNGNLSSENIQAGGITSDKLTIANGFITNAMIANLDVSKINAGNISTNKFRIVSDNGGIEIVGSTQQFKDKNNKVRIQMGQDAKGNFNFILRGEDGTTTLIDHTGIKEKAIADNLIKGNMVATDAIGEKQINYSSLITGLNKDTNTQLIKASKVAIDFVGQSLEVAFNSLKNQADNAKLLIENHSTTIGVMQGQINTVINNTQIVKDGKTILLKDDYNRTVSKVDSINSTIGTHTTKINELTGNITSVDTKVNSIQRDLEGTKSTVSSHTNLIDGLNSKVSTQGSSIEQLKNQITLKVNSTELTTMKNELIGKIDSIEIGGRNTLLNATGNLGNTNHWSNVVLDTNKKVEGCNSFKITRNNFANGNARYQGSQTIDLSRLSLKANDYITLSGWVYVDSSINLTGSSNEFAFRNYYNSSSSFEDLCVFKYTNVQKNTWTKFSVTSKVTKDSYKAGALLLSISANGLIYVSKLKLEKGSKATDFTLAPEDVDSEIGTKANKTDVYVKSEVYTKSQTDSAINIAKDSINLGVSQTYETKSNVESKITTAVNNVQVGGRNLAQGTSNIYTTAYSSFSGGTNTCPSLAKVLTDGLVVGDTVTVKLIYKYTNIVATSGQTAKCWIQGYGNSTIWNGGTFNSSAQKVLSGSGEHTFLYSFKITPEHLKNSSWCTSIRHDYVQSGSVQWKMFKVEKGNKATDWIPAPEDIDSVIGTKANKSDVYVKSEVYTKAQTDSAIKVAKDSIELGVKNTYETKTDVENKITNAVNSIQLGGRNLFLKSNIDQYGLGNWIGNGGGIGKVEGTFIDGTKTIKVTGYSGIQYNSFIKLKRNTTYVYSMMMKSSGSMIVNSSNPLHMWLNTSETGGKHLEKVISASGNLEANKWTKVWVVFETPNTQDVYYMKPFVYGINTNTVYISKVQIEEGTKCTDWTPAPEDIDSVIDSKANKTDVYTKSEVYTKVQTDSAINVAKDSINLSVSGTYETKTNVESKINTAKANAINSAKSYTDGQITTVNKTITNKVSEIKATTDSIYQKVSTTESKITTINNNISGLTNRVSTAESKLTATSLTTTISSAISGGTSSISTTQFVMDKNGLTIKNGGLIIQNKAGTTVLNSDTNGNLIFTGTAKSQSGARWVGLDSGGITFQDSQKNEQMLRIAISYFNENRDINGVNLSLAKYGDYIRISHIDKADLTTGWSSSNTQYNFMDFWSSDQIVDGVAYKKGINVYAPMYINKRLKLYSGTNFLSEIDGAISWNNGTGTVNNLLGMYGDNGAVLGYKSGDSFNARFLVSEVSHPGTGDNLISWGNYNGNGYTLHNFNIVAKSLSVQGSKNCLQETKSYGARLINAYETAEYFFGDLGFGKINEEGVCYVDIDDVFLECVNTDAQYHVFTQIYNGKITSIERYKTYFIVKGEQNTEFSWELKAKRKGYEINRLDLPDIETQGDEIDIFSFENEIETDEEDLMKELTFELENLLLKEHEKDE